MTDSHSYTLAGWREWVSLPTIGVPWVKAKLDTGARSSSIHAFDLEDLERDGERWARFRIQPWQRSEADAVQCECPVLDVREVRSSSGHAEERLVVAMDLVLMGRTIAAEMTLRQPRRDGLPDARRPRGAAPGLRRRPGPLLPRRPPAARDAPAQPGEGLMARRPLRPSFEIGHVRVRAGRTQSVSLPITRWSPAPTSSCPSGSSTGARRDRPSGSTPPSTATRRSGSRWCGRSSPASTRRRSAAP